MQDRKGDRVRERSLLGECGMSMCGMLGVIIDSVDEELGRSGCMQLCYTDEPVAHTHNSSTAESDAGGAEILDYHRLHSNTLP